MVDGRGLWAGRGGSVWLGSGSIKVTDNGEQCSKKKKKKKKERKKRDKATTDDSFNNSLQTR